MVISRYHYVPLTPSLSHKGERGLLDFFTMRAAWEKRFPRPTGGEG